MLIISSEKAEKYREYDYSLLARDFSILAMNPRIMEHDANYDDPWETRPTAGTIGAIKASSTPVILHWNDGRIERHDSCTDAYHALGYTKANGGINNLIAAGRVNGFTLEVLEKPPKP